MAMTSTRRHPLFARFYGRVSPLRFADRLPAGDASCDAAVASLVL